MTQKQEAKKTKDESAVLLNLAEICLHVVRYIVR